MNAEALQSLQTILNNYDLTNLSIEEEAELLNQLEKEGLLNVGLFINVMT